MQRPTMHCEHTDRGHTLGGYTMYINKRLDYAMSDIVEVGIAM